MSYLAINRPSRSQEWNGIVTSVSPLIRRHVDLQISQVSVLYPRLDFSVAASGVRWQLIHACIEVAYSDLMPTGFFFALANYYLHGHYPCGWDGDYPDG